MKKLQDAIKSVKNEFTVKHPNGTAVLEKQDALVEVIEDIVDNTGYEQTKIRRIAEKAISDVEKALAPFLKYWEEE